MSTRSLRALGPRGPLLLAGTLLSLVLSLWSPAARAACPNLVILLDQSASMSKTPQGDDTADVTKSKWGIATAALMALNLKYTQLLPIGYANFPSRESSCDTTGFNIPVGYNDVHLIDNALRASPWKGGSTPTCDAVTKLAAEPLLKDASRRQYVVLVTDGDPAADCCGANPVQKTVDALTAARMQNPSILTFVVGFGKLMANQQDALNQMAMAGGLPTSDPAARYYKADDAQSLDVALSAILKTLSGGDAGPTINCEDGCYGTGCPQGEVCLQNACKADLCAGATCGAGTTCFSDGKTQLCIPVCTQTCPFGSRCDRGRCVADPCSGQCTAGQVCSAAKQACEDDPKCKNVVCHRTQGCFAGRCVDNPCTTVVCPAGLYCKDFNGTCEPPPAAPTPYEGGSGGCELAPRSVRAELAAPLAAGALLAAAWGLRRRRAARA